MYSCPRDYPRSEPACVAPPLGAAFVAGIFPTVGKSASECQGRKTPDARVSASWRADRPTACQLGPVGIRSFGSRATRRFARSDLRRLPPAVRDAAIDMLALTQEARFPRDTDRPGARLRTLKGDRKDSNAVRLSGRWRLAFRFPDGDAYYVEVVDDGWSQTSVWTSTPPTAPSPPRNSGTSQTSFALVCHSLAASSATSAWATG